MIRQSFARSAPVLLSLCLALPAQAAFTDNGDGTVTDTATGLIWDKCSWGQSGADCGAGTATTHNWQGALGVAVTANGASYKGHNDWRLPNKNELESLVKIDANNPAIDAMAFPNYESYYWSSTNYVVDPTFAWGVRFDGGFFEAGSKANGHYVRLVRSGQSFDSFDAQGDYTPDAFSFTAQTGVALSAAVISNPITVAGIDAPTPISIAGGAYSVNGGAYTAATGTVDNGDTVTVQQSSAASHGATSTAILTIGGVSGAFGVVTTSNAATAIVIDAAAPAKLYTGFDGAGVYRSGDGGATWTAADTQPANLRVKALAIKPDGTRLFAATYGGGAFTSGDSGASWSACAGQPGSANLLSLALGADGKLYAGSEVGVFVSTDDCVSWTAMNTGLP